MNSPCGKCLHVYEKYWNEYDIKLQSLWWRLKLLIPFYQNIHIFFYIPSVYIDAQFNNTVNAKNRA